MAQFVKEIKAGGPASKGASEEAQADGLASKAAAGTSKPSTGSQSQVQPVIYCTACVHKNCRLKHHQIFHIMRQVLHVSSAIIYP